MRTASVRTWLPIFPITLSVFVHPGQELHSILFPFFNENNNFAKSHNKLNDRSTLIVGMSACDRCVCSAPAEQVCLIPTIMYDSVVPPSALARRGVRIDIIVDTISAAMCIVHEHRGPKCKCEEVNEREFTHFSCHCWQIRGVDLRVPEI